MREGLLLALAVLLGGCVTAFPEEILRTVNRSLSLAELRRDPAAHVGERVVVGGEILATRPRPGETEVEVLGRRLGGDLAPEREDRSEGRVLVTTGEFLDPAVYAAGRRITVVGRVTGVEERTIGEVPYRYPVVAAEQIRLWPRDPPEIRFVQPYPPPGWYWPYYYVPGPYRYRYLHPWPPWWW